MTEDFKRCKTCGVSGEIYEFHEECSRCLRHCMCGRSLLGVAWFRSTRAARNVQGQLQGLLWHAKHFFDRCEKCKNRLLEHERGCPTCEACYGAADAEG